VRPGETLSYLELTAPAQLRPGRTDPRLTVVATDDAATVRTTTLAIGAPYAWPTQLWDERAWRDYLADPAVKHWAAQCGGAAVGLASVRFGAAEIVIEAFGLLPGFIGQGLGGPFLTAVVRAAWAQAPTADRLWLSTSDLDAPHALPNYTARGFTVIRRVGPEPPT